MGEVRSIASGSGYRAAALRLLGDRALARLAARGDARVFAVIYERYHQPLYRYCRSLTGNADDAADALQSTMAAALRALRGETRDIRLRPWLFRIAHNESISLLRARRPHAQLAEAPGLEAPAADRQAGARERLRGLIADLGELPERQRGALLMRELSGLDYGEIAAALGLSPAAARQAAYEARAALHELADGRDMRCDAARRSLSARDGRMLKGRKLRAHLRACHDCSDFSERLVVRRSALRAVVPALPTASGATILAGLIGGGAAGGVGAGTGGGGLASLAGGAASQATGVSAAVKGAAAVALTVVAGVGTVEVARSPGPPATHGQQRAPLVTAERSATGPMRNRVERTAPVPGGQARDEPSSRHSRPRDFRPGNGGRHLSLRAERRPLVRRGAGQLPTLPGRQPAKPVPLPAPQAQTPSPPAPAVPPATSLPAWQQHYAAGVLSAQQALEAGRQSYVNAMTTAKELLNRFLPGASR